MEFNIPALVDNIQPEVKRAQQKNPGKSGNDLIPMAIEENVWQGVEDLFMRSAATRELVKSGKFKVVGAHYDVTSGQVSWLPETKVAEILASVEKNPKRGKEAMAGGAKHGH